VTMQGRILVGITDYVEPPFNIEKEVLGDAYDLVPLHWNEKRQAFDDDPEVLRALKGLLVWHAHINQRVIDTLEACEIVTRYGVGYDNLDLVALSKAGIKACNTPDYGTEEVADTAAAMILALQRKIFLYDFKARDITSGWQEHVIPPLSRLRTQTLGVIGVGRIGTALINRMKCFGVRIVGYDPYQPRGHEKAVGYERVDSLSELAKISDIVSINCVLTSETQDMIDRTFIHTMKKGAILVNTARGRLIANIDHIIEALLDNHLSAAGLDVLPDEPPEKTDLYKKWLMFDERLKGRLIINPHSAYYSDESWKDMRRLSALSVKMYFEKHLLRSPIIQ